jgi:hypothetical protein
VAAYLPQDWPVRFIDKNIRPASPADYNPGAVYFVDNNFVGNRKAIAELLPHLIDWQKSNGYPVQFMASFYSQKLRGK